MTPNGEHDVASGNWKLVGSGSIGGAGGPDRTTRVFEFILPLAA
jgi:hypothetical protein